MNYDGYTTFQAELTDGILTVTIDSPYNVQVVWEIKIRKSLTRITILSFCPQKIRLKRT